MSEYEPGMKFRDQGFTRQQFALVEFQRDRWLTTMESNSGVRLTVDPDYLHHFCQVEECDGTSLCICLGCFPEQTAIVAENSWPHD